jgi:FKBP-type peptidyl-prolyl cis-trans isomerase
MHLQRNNQNDGTAVPVLEGAKMIGRVRMVLLAASLIALATAAAAAEKKDLKSKRDRLSYSAGYDMAIKIKESGIDLDYDVVLQATRDVLKGRKTLMTREEVGDAIMAYRVDRKNELAEKNRKEGQAFLAANKQKDGVVTLPSGLQYKVLKEGTGKAPGPEDVVTVQYRGTLIDGSEFDSSYMRSQPSTFALNQVVRGWTEGLQLMKEGGKAQLVIPPDLGYGERGTPGGPIGPDAVLIFEIELLSVATAPEGAQ